MVPIAAVHWSFVRSTASTVMYSIKIAALSSTTPSCSLTPLLIGHRVKAEHFDSSASRVVILRIILISIGLPAPFRTDQTHDGSRTAGRRVVI